MLGLGGLDRLGLDHWFFGLNRFRLHWLGLRCLGLDGLGLGLNRFRCCRLRLGGDGCLEGGVSQVEARAHLHFVGVTQLVDADQAGHWQLVGLGDLREGLPFGNSVFRSSRDRGYSHGLEGRTGHHGIAGKSQGLADLNVVGICLLYTSPSPRDPKTSRMPSSA